MNRHHHIVIVGGGPVGLFLGICLARRKIPCLILEKRENPITDSRSLGIHPTSLELFDKTGIIEPFLKAGLKIEKGIAHSGKKELGEIDLTKTAKPYNYILACPQFKTEQILRKEFKSQYPDFLITGAEVESFKETKDAISIKFTLDGKTQTITTNYLVGCDGKNSFVRENAGIEFKGKNYPDTYIMGDFTDNTPFGNKAVVYLSSDGMIECFPLPNGLRRWVVKTDSYIKKATKEAIAYRVKKRLGFSLETQNVLMLSSFGVQHQWAQKMVKNRIILAGDSAHVVSPIGGQGMNLGWIDAWELASTFHEIQHKTSTKVVENAFRNYERKQQEMARTVAKRAEVNMRLGRKSSFGWIRNFLLKQVLKSAYLNKKAAQLFTMRGL